VLPSPVCSLDRVGTRGRDAWAAAVWVAVAQAFLEKVAGRSPRGGARARRFGWFRVPGGVRNGAAGAVGAGAGRISDRSPLSGFSGVLLGRPGVGLVQ